MRGNSSLAKNQLYSQEGLRPMEKLSKEVSR